MKSHAEILDLIMKKFPRQEKRIEQLFYENEDFKTLCQDYSACIESLKRFRKSLNESEGSMVEYERAIEDLEIELYSFIF